MATLEAKLGYDNIKSAALAVRRNKGAAGVDGMKPNDLIKWFYDHPYMLTGSILGGSYRPQLNQESIYSQAQRQKETAQYLDSGGQDSIGRSGQCSAR